MTQLPGTIDISKKETTWRRAVAISRLVAPAEVIAAVRDDRLPKKDPIPTARAAAMLAVKQTPMLIPHCHPIAITGILVEFEFEETSVTARCEVASRDRTGPEIEALYGASVATLTLYDVTKGICQGARIEETRLLEKEGGKSGHWTSEQEKKTT